MSLMGEFCEKANTDKKTIVLPEGSDERIIDAAEAITKKRICRSDYFGG